MKHIRPSQNAHQWPRKRVSTLPLRAKDLVIRVTDWSRDKEEPAYDVEVYIGGVYDWNESNVFSCLKEDAKAQAGKFAAMQIHRLL